MEELGNETILIIDDQTANIYALKNLLEKPGREILFALNGNNGLKAALSQSIDLIILDVQMPDMDGFEVAQVLKSHKRTKDIPIIFASAIRKEKQSIMKGFEEGAVDYLSKPLDPELTKAKVSVLLKIQQQRRELLQKNLSLEKAEHQIKLLNADLHHNLTQLETLNKDLESFSYSVSHDLRSPLRSIIGFAEALVEDYGDKLNDDAKKMLDSLQRNARRMNTLINDLLEFSRLGRQEIRKSKVEFDRLVRSVIENCTQGIPSKPVFEIDALYPASADYSLILQVWTNLISNAIKYSSKNPEPRIKIGCSQEANEYIYYINDNGAGFNMEYVDKLFSVFQRLHRDTDFEGTGVGLALAHRIIAKHGGRIWAEGRVGEGATFYFSLP